jgi:hypothetical protein
MSKDDIHHRVAAKATVVVLGSNTASEVGQILTKYFPPPIVDALAMVGSFLGIDGATELGEYLKVPAEQLQAYKEMARKLEDKAAADLEKEIRSDGEQAAAALEAIDAEDKAAADLEDQIRSDGKTAAAALEELDVELATTLRDQPNEDEQERNALNAKFEEEEKDLVGKLSTIEEKYFDGHPDLTEDQRVDAEETFKGVRGDALGLLEAHQQTELLQLEQVQQERRQELTQAIEQVEQTRDERS